MNRRVFLADASALTPAPVIPVSPSPNSPGVVDRGDRFKRGQGGGIPGIYGWGPRYGNPEDPRQYRGSPQRFGQAQQQGSDPMTIPFRSAIGGNPEALDRVFGRQPDSV